MTTVFAIECKDSIILASDTQYTGRFKEKGKKTWELRDNVLLGCAGVNNYNYLFWRRLRDEFDKKADITLPDRIDKGIYAFNKEMKQIFPSLIQAEPYQPQGIVVGFDEGLAKKKRGQGAFVMFEANPPHPCVEVEASENLRAAAGTGGFAATVVLKTLEILMDRYGVFYTDISWQTIARLSWLILSQITSIDPQSSGKTIIRIEDSDYNQIEEREIFDAKTDYVYQLLDGIMKEVGQGKLLRLLSDWKVLDAIAGMASRGDASS